MIALKPSLSRQGHLKIARPFPGRDRCPSNSPSRTGRLNVRLSCPGSPAINRPFGTRGGQGKADAKDACAGCRLAATCNFARHLWLIGLHSFILLASPRGDWRKATCGGEWKRYDAFGADWRIKRICIICLTVCGNLTAAADARDIAIPCRLWKKPGWDWCRDCR